MESNSDNIFVISIILLSGFLFVGFWMGIIKLVSLFGGWGKLSKSYKFNKSNKKPDIVKSFQSAQIGLSNYNGVLTFSYYPDGFAMEVMIFFRVGHPKLFIPWTDIKIKEKGKSIFIWNALEIGKPPIVTLSVNNKVLDLVKSYTENITENEDRW